MDIEKTTKVAEVLGTDMIAQLDAKLPTVCAKFDIPESVAKWILAEGAKVGLSIGQEVAKAALSQALELAAIGKAVNA